MTKKNWFLISVALVLAGIYVVYFTNWFKPKIIHIASFNSRAAMNTRVRTYRTGLPGFMDRLSSLNPSPTASPALVPINFKLEQPYKLTELKVVALDEWQTNKNCLPLWHLVADTNSVPVSGIFTYGHLIRGMKTAVPGAQPMPLKPGVKYRLLITDGSAVGHNDFQPLAAPAAVQPAVVGR
jgi:hypothetical protein